MKYSTGKSLVAADPAKGRLHDFDTVGNCGVQIVAAMLRDRSRYKAEDDKNFAMEIEFLTTTDGILKIMQARPWLDSRLFFNPALGHDRFHGGLGAAAIHMRGGLANTLSLTKEMLARASAPDAHHYAGPCT